MAGAGPTAARASAPHDVTGSSSHPPSTHSTTTNNNNSAHHHHHPPPPHGGSHGGGGGGSNISNNTTSNSNNSISGSSLYQYHHHYHSKTSSAADNLLDPAALLARGFTARYLGAILSKLTTTTTAASTATTTTSFNNNSYNPASATKHHQHQQGSSSNNNNNYYYNTKSTEKVPSSSAPSTAATTAKTSTPTTAAATTTTTSTTGTPSPANSRSSLLIAPLSDDQIEYDLRHIVAHQEAATRYHQLRYASTNRLATHNINNNSTDPNNGDALNNNSTNANANANNSLHLLPVKIDPEAEKRATALRKRIARAEAVREELEQHYVTLRAHYVTATQDLQQTSTTVLQAGPLLQAAVGHTATTLGYQRARLEMTRNVAAALAARNAAFYNNNNSGNSGLGLSHPPGVIPTPSAAAAMEGVATTDPALFANGADSCPMLAAWLAVEEQCKQHCMQQNGNNNNVGNSKTTKTKQQQQQQNTIPWPCTTQPLMPPGVPILLSALSTDPCKSLAVGVGSLFGSSHRHNMTWMESHLPVTAVPDNDDNEDDDAKCKGSVPKMANAEILVDQSHGVKQSELGKGEGIKKTEDDWSALTTSLRSEVAYLSDELALERQSNQALLVTTAAARTQHDEWVAMIALVRQETEAVLHRHNILLESDEVQQAIATAAEVASQQQEEEQNDPLQPDNDPQQPNKTGPDDDEDPLNEDPNLHGDGIGETRGIDTALLPQSVVTTTAGVADSAMGGVFRKKGADPEEDDEGDANEADDEGMEEEGEEGDDWDSTLPPSSGNPASINNSNKRSVANAEDPEDSEESPGGSRKRRKM